MRHVVRQAAVVGRGAGDRGAVHHEACGSLHERAVEGGRAVLRAAAARLGVGVVLLWVGRQGLLWWGQRDGHWG